jgi:general secretion pathway protein N
LQNGVFNGALDALWLKASSGICNINPLGNYLLNIEGKHKLLTLRLSTLDGALNLQGDGYFSMQSGLTFNGIAKANKQQQAMTPLLHLIGNERAIESGLFQFNF